MAAKKLRITKRVEPCGCGCQGRDPQHRLAYRRVVREVRPAAGRVWVEAYCSPVRIIREGVARLPGRGSCRVVEVISNFGGQLEIDHNLGWFLADDYKNESPDWHGGGDCITGLTAAERAL